MRVAALDIGTNSIRLLKAEILEGKLISGPKELNMTRIGEGVNETGMLSEAGMTRSVEALVDFNQKAIDWGAKHIFALATSAVRDAGNRQDFLNRVKKACGLEIEVISGDHEARIGYLGVLAGLESIEGNILVIDVGGGSTELIVGDASGIKFVHSANVGAVRMTGKHIKSDPISEREYRAVKQDIADITKQVIVQLTEHPISKAVGIGGTATTLGAMKLEMEAYDRYKIQNSCLSISEIEKINEKLKNLNIKERQTLKGLQPKRADIILAGAMVIEHVLTSINVENMFVSDFDNLEGCLMEKLILNNK